MNLEEAQEILKDSRLDWQFEVGTDINARISFKDTEDEIIFTEDDTYYKYRTYDNCNECGRPTNWETKAKEITKEDLREMVNDQ